MSIQTIVTHIHSHKCVLTRFQIMLIAMITTLYQPVKAQCLLVYYGKYSTQMAAWVLQHSCLIVTSLSPHPHATYIINIYHTLQQYCIVKHLQKPASQYLHRLGIYNEAQKASSATQNTLL